jgi:lysophospholipase L1-like esterase
VKALIQAAIAAPAQRPWLAWGPYIWTDGLRGRSDGLVWTCSDVQSDGTHPSASGSAKIARLLHAFFTSDPSAMPWFTRQR